MQTRCQYRVFPLYDAGDRDDEKRSCVACAYGVGSPAECMGSLFEDAWEMVDLREGEEQCRRGLRRRDGMSGAKDSYLGRSVLSARELWTGRVRVRQQGTWGLLEGR